VYRDYADITSRLGPCKWYDGNSVPRYEEFSPNMCDVYNRYVAFMEIACQSCDKRFLVASEISMMQTYQVSLPISPLEGDEKKIDEVTRKLDKEGGLSPWEQIGSFHYGDPPRHGTEETCVAGDTMNSVPVRILQFWKKDNKGFEWIRDPKFEFELVKFERDNDD
jgi:hypothetical protein